MIMINTRLPLIALLILMLVSLTPSAKSQPSADDKSKREKFGSSLKDLKWDKKKQAAVDKKKEKPSKKPAPHADSSDDEAIKLDTLLVVLDVVVADQAKSKFITGLSKDDFVVVEDGQPQQIATFNRGDDASLPRSIVLVIDYSGSQLPYLKSSIVAAKALINRLASADEMAIVTDDIELLVDFTSDKSKLFSALDAVERLATGIRREDKFGRAVPVRRGRNLQFSALFAALRELSVKEDRRNIIIFQTDGGEAVTLRDQPESEDYLWNMPRREYGLADIYRAAERSKSTIYTIIPNERLTDLATDQRYERGREMLRRIESARFATEEEYNRHAKIFPLTDAKVRLFTDRFTRGQESASRVAELTGGWTAFLERPEQAAEIYDRILTDINNRYIIGYYPTNTARDGSQRRVRIEVRGHTEYSVHGRSVYYAPEDK
jgi:VWFA-related protein